MLTKLRHINSKYFWLQKQTRIRLGTSLINSRCFSSSDGDEELEDEVNLLSGEVLLCQGLMYEAHEHPRVNLNIYGYPMYPLDDNKMHEASSAYSNEEIQELK